VPGLDFDEQFGPEQRRDLDRRACRRPTGVDHLVAVRADRASRADGSPEGARHR
jgi:hypothetical protein